MNPILAFLFKIYFYCLVTFGIWLSIIETYTHVSDKAEQSQFYDDDYDFIVYSNLSFALVAAIALSCIRCGHLGFYWPYLNLAACSLFTGISSGLFHSSYGYGRTPELDVASIVPFMIAVAYLICWVFYAALKFHWNYNNIFGLSPRNDFNRIPGGSYGPVLHSLVLITEAVLFVLYYNHNVDVPFETQMDIFLWGIASLFIVGAVMVLYTSTRWLALPGHNSSLCFYLLTLIVSFVCLGIVYAVGLEYDEYKHGIDRHILTGGAIACVTFYTRAIMRNINLKMKRSNTL